MNPLALAFVSILVFRSGHQIEVVGPVNYQRDTAVFRAASSGALYSIPSSEIDRPASDRATELANRREEEKRKKLKVTPEEAKRLIDELQQNHGGTAPPRQATLETPPVAQTEQEKKVDSADEWRWRREARTYDEGVRQAQENLDLLESRIRATEDRITGFLQLGYKPAQFTYDTSQLQQMREAIPDAELALRRAERARAQFLDDARRQGVLPGWLR